MWRAFRDGLVKAIADRLLALGGDRSPYVERAVQDLGNSGYDVSIDVVPYEFQRGGNQMMRIRDG